MASLPLHERFWSKAHTSDRQDACWLWGGAIKNNGYGNFYVAGKWISAHRVAYELTHGPLDPKQHVLHTCDVRACVSPAHLRAGSRQENMDDMVRKGRQTRGEKHPDCTVSDAIVAEIRARWDVGGITQSALAREYGISKTHARQIVRRTRRNWPERVEPA